jgi:predicted 3-demethylubiquinone-9 3-methyltransferase (glyoxalase superfamily)
MPKKYYEVFNNSKEAAVPRAPKTFESRTTDGVVAIHKT